MDSISVINFRDNLKRFVEQVITEHLPLKVTRRSGEDFVVLSADDWYLKVVHGPYMKN